MITPLSHLWPLAPALQTLVTDRGGPANCDKFELDDTVLRAGGYAWDIGDALAAPLHAQIAAIKAQREADRIAAENAPPTKEALKARIAWRRWEEESTGAPVTLNGETWTIKSDPESQAKLTGLLVVASAQPISVKWKDSAGSFHDITNADVSVMVGSVFGHVQSCFAREADLLAALEAATDTKAFASVVDAFWPG